MLLFSSFSGTGDTKKYEIKERQAVIIIEVAINNAGTKKKGPVNS